VTTSVSLANYSIEVLVNRLHLGESDAGEGPVKWRLTDPPKPSGPMAGNAVKAFP
jgi:hypothetical protein